MNLRNSAAWTAFGFAACMLSVSDTAMPADAARELGGAPRVVNVTSDSEPGWLPSAEQERDARTTAIEYMADMDGGKYADAYSLLSELDRKDNPFSAYSDRLRQFNAQAGAAVERRITTVTWTKNPPPASAPLPGVY